MSWNSKQSKTQHEQHMYVKSLVIITLSVVIIISSVVIITLTVIINTSSVVIITLSSQYHCVEEVNNH